MQQNSRRAAVDVFQVIYGIEMSFIIQAKDTLNDKRQSGGDKFVCEIVNIDPTGKFSVKGESRVVDHGDGLYMVYYTVPYPTKYEVHIKYEEPAMAEGEEPSYVSVGAACFGLGRAALATRGQAGSSPMPCQLL